MKKIFSFLEKYKKALYILSFKSINKYNIDYVSKIKAI